MKRSPLRSKPRRTGPSDEVVALVWERDRGRCACCHGACFGERGIDWSVHHRSGRRAGGSRRPWVNMPGNLLLLHGHGTVSCHGYVEAQRGWAESAGFVVRNGVRLPADVPVLHAVLGGWVLLADDGTWEAA